MSGHMEQSWAHPWGRHTEINYCTRENIYTKEKTYSIKDIFKFVFVRNPWDREVSHFEFKKRYKHFSINFSELFKL